MLPPQAAPVRRPEIVAPHTAVNVQDGSREQLAYIRIQLIHGANFNDPQYFAYPTYERMKVSAWRR